VSYRRAIRFRLTTVDEAQIERALLRGKEIVEDKRVPISYYNYSTLRDRLAKKGISVSVTTIINRAKRLGCYKPRKKRKVHDREVLTASIGDLTVLKGEVDRFNNHQVHSTTKEIPRIRFDKAWEAGNSLFRPFSLAKYHMRRLRTYSVWGRPGWSTATGGFLFSTTR